MLCWLHQSELRGGWSASSSRSPGTYQWNLHPAVCHAPPAALPPIPFLRMMLTGAGSSRRGAQLTPKECERRWRSAVRELRKAVEADHAYAEEVPPQHPFHGCTSLLRLDEPGIRSSAVVHECSKHSGLLVTPSQAQKSEAVSVATSVLRRAGAETDAVLDDIARIVAVCSGPAATGALARLHPPFMP